MKKLLLTAFILFLSVPAFAQDIVPTPDWDTKLLGDWAGARSTLADHGVIVEWDATHTSQHVFDGGVDSNILGREFDDTEHMVSSEAIIQLDTNKAGLWPGGLFRLGIEGRTGDSALNRSRSLVNNDAAFPAVSGHGGEPVLAINELTAMQFLSERFGVVAGLLNTTEGDNNAFAGNARSNDYFMNSAFLYNLTTVATTPDVTLGAGVIMIPNERIMGSIVVMNTEGSAGYNPFDNDEGTTFSTEWSRTHTLGGKSGTQTLGAVYGIDKERTDLYASPRLAISSLIINQTLPATDEDTWAIYYNAHQFIQGDEEKGWGVFARAGLSDGDPNPIEEHVAVGVGGKGLFDARPNDRFGAGAFWIGFSDDGLPAAINIDNSSGFEAFYSFEVVPGLNITPDIQVIDSPLPRVDDTTVVGAIRTKWEF
jgi:porin